MLEFIWLRLHKLLQMSELERKPQLHIRVASHRIEIEAKSAWEQNRVLEFKYH